MTRCTRWEIVAFFEALEILSHVTWAPRCVSRNRLQVRPVTVMRIEGKHGIVRAASTNGCGARVQNTQWGGSRWRIESRIGTSAWRSISVFAVFFGLSIIGVVLHPVVPSEERILSRLCMKGWHLVILVLLLVVTGFNQKHTVTGNCKSRSQWSTACTRA